MFDFLYSYVFWIVVIVVLLVVIFITSNFDLRKKEKKRGKVEVSSFEDYTESSFDSDYTSESTGESKSESKSKSEDIIESRREDIIESRSESESSLFVPRNPPELPSHIADPDWKPEYYYKSNFESMGEKECKEAALRIWGVPFMTVRPDWLKNKRNMELDCYNEEANVAIEYQGKQHFEVVKKYHRNGIQDLQSQQARDELKRVLCKARGIHLIEVDYTVPINKIEEYIRYKAADCIEMRQKMNA